MNDPNFRYVRIPSQRRLGDLFAILAIIVMMVLLGFLFDIESATIKLLTIVVATMAYALARVIMRLRQLEQQHHQWQQQSVDQSMQNYRQAEALISVHTMIQPELALPSTRDWSMSPDTLYKLCQLTFDGRPRMVIEASSGVSTIVIGYCLKKIGAGRLIALEHDAQFADRTGNHVRDHHLTDFVQVIHAPLVSHEINQRKYQWYDISSIDSIQQIDMLVIDGPPTPPTSDQLIRFPAVPLLHDRLADGCTILLDDAYREQEQQVVQLWLQQFPNLSHELIECEKGASILVNEGMRSDSVD